MCDEEEYESEYEDEYTADQENEPAKINTATENPLHGSAANLDEILKNISGTLMLLNEQITTFNSVAKNLPLAANNLEKVTNSLNDIAKDLPAIVHTNCMNEYKNIVTTAAKNYQTLQKSAIKWQESLQEKNQNQFKMISISAIITPLLLLVLLLK